MNRWLPGILFFFALALVAGHALWPAGVALDGVMLVLLVVVAIVALAPILVSAEIPGLAALHFRQQVRKGLEVSDEVDSESTVLAAKAALRRAEEASGLFSDGVGGDEAPSDATRVGEADAEQSHEIPDVQSALDLFNISDTVRDLIPRDPELALAGLRIAIEGGVRAALDFLISDPAPRFARLSLGRAVRRLHEVSAMTETQAQLLLVIVDLCQKAVHGQSVTPADAVHVFDMADTLNRSFALGYSLSFQPNPHWREQGLLCEYEHCVEHMPLDELRNDGSCPLFGHNCPGGSEVVDSCDVAQDYR